MNLSRFNPKFIAGFAIIIISIGALVLFGLKPSTPDGAPQWRGELEIWGVFDNSKMFEELVKQYSDTTGTTIKYFKKEIDSYERDLVNALAAGQGPDIFMVHNTWIPKHKDKMLPADLQWVSPDQMQQIFPDVVIHDFVGDEGRTWAVPLYLDSLALYYNRDHFNDAGITNPPETWEEFFEAVEKLTRLDELGNITRAGAALGAAHNVNRSTDILSLLMMQSGSDMVSENHRDVTFNTTIRVSGERPFVPGIDALRFYTDFANPTKPIYTWNRDQDYSIDMFVQERSSMMINYHHHIASIEAKTPYLNYGVSFLPQVNTEDIDVNYASYWGLGASRVTDAPTVEAWRFLLWMTGETPQGDYQSATGRPPAHRTLIDTYKDTAKLGVFARQALTARNWYQPDSNAVENILAEAIDAVLLGVSEIDDAISTAEKRIEELLNQR